jgi:serine/threonine protein kinase
MLRLLKDLHAMGYVHRDVKPSNFVREADESKYFKLIDFGVTKQVYFYSLPILY